mmetsp:Transcript_3734/g.9656  ORF Transcript_3734/g.9656 Transcript_3734/m.9656 type:complete len:325 (-) Transcript_3734:643-1617(-)
MDARPLNTCKRGHPVATERTLQLPDDLGFQALVPCDVLSLAPACFCQAIHEVVRDATPNADGIHCSAGRMSTDKLEYLLRVADLAICEDDDSALEACWGRLLEDHLQGPQQLRAPKVGLDGLSVVAGRLQGVLIIGNSSFEKQVGAAAEADDIEAAPLRKAAQEELQSLCCTAYLTSTHRAAAVEEEYEFFRELDVRQPLILLSCIEEALHCGHVWVKHSEDCRHAVVYVGLDPTPWLKGARQLDAQHHFAVGHARQLHRRLRLVRVAERGRACEVVAVRRRTNTHHRTGHVEAHSEAELRTPRPLTGLRHNRRFGGCLRLASF